MSYWTYLFVTFVGPFFGLAAETLIRVLNFIMIQTVRDCISDLDVDGWEKEQDDKRQK